MKSSTSWSAAPKVEFLSLARRALAAQGVAMALPSTLHRFELDLSDVDRGVYESLEFRIAKHPSETTEYALVRVLAYALEYRPELEFGPGLSTSDEPALSVVLPTGEIDLWLDVGGPSADRLHKASKRAKDVVVYTHRDPASLRQEWDGKRIHRREDIRVVSVPRALLRELSSSFGRTNAWSVLRTEGVVYVTCGGETREWTPEFGGL